MDEIEVGGLAEYFFHHQDVMDHWIDAVGIKPQCFSADGKQPRVSDRVAAGKQRDIVAERYQCFRQPRYDAFRSSIEAGRNTLEKRRDLSYFHWKRFIGVLFFVLSFFLPLELVEVK